MINKKNHKAKFFITTIYMHVYIYIYILELASEQECTMHLCKKKK